MGRRKKWKVDLLSGRTAALVLLGVLFFLGSVAGCVAAGLIQEDGANVLTDYVRGYLEALGRNELSVRFLPLFWEIIRFPLMVFLFGLTALGVVGLPALFGVRGFMLGYAVSVFYRLLGVIGLVPAFCLFGVSALFWMPALFVLGVQGLLASYGLLRRTTGDGRYPLCFNSGYFWRCSGCLLALCLGTGVEYLLVPVLLQGIAGLF